MYGQGEKNMKRMLAILLLTVILMGVFSTLNSAVVWDNPADIFRYDNVDFYGVGTETSDGHILTSWRSGTGDDKRCYVQKYNSEMLPVWENPVSIINGGYSVIQILETSDGNYIVLWLLNTSYTSRLMAIKLAPDGTHIWNPEGVIVINYLSYGDPRYKAVADRQGGAYLAIEDRTHTEIYLQHIDSNGSVSLGANGIALTTFDGLYYPDLIVGNDNNAIVSYCYNSEITLSKITPTGTNLWTQTIVQPEPHNAYVRPYLTPADGDSLYVAACSGFRILVYKYDTNGNSLWQNPVTISEPGGTGLLMDSYSVKLVTVNDAGMFITWLERESQGSYDNLYIQKVSPTGQKLWGEDGHHIYGDGSVEIYDYVLKSDSMGGVYLDYNSLQVDASGYHCSSYVQHITSAGTMWTQSVLAADITFSGSQGLWLMGAVSNGNLVLCWRGFRDNVSGIFAQVINLQGSLLLNEDGNAIETGYHGYGNEPVLTSGVNSVMAFWLQMNMIGSPYAAWQVRYQKVVDTGNLSLPLNGTALSIGYNQTLSNLQAITSQDNYTLVTWAENYSTLRGQMFNPSGSIIWETGGRIITSSLSNSSQYKLSTDGNGINIIWVGNSRRIFGQRYAEGEYLWLPSGNQLVQNHPDYPNYYCTLTAVAGNYLTWTLNPSSTEAGGILAGFAYVMKFDDAGGTVSGFNSYGNRICNLPLDYNWGQSVQEVTLFGEEAILVVSNWQQWYDEQEYQYYYIDERVVQKISSTGDQMLNADGLEWHYSGVTITHNNEIFYADGLNIYRYDANLTQTGVYQVSGINTQNMRYIRVFVTDENRLLIAAQASISNNWEALHFYFDLSANSFFLPEDMLLASENNMYSLTAARLGDDFAVMWSAGSTYYSDVMQMNLVNNGEVGNDDETEVQVTGLQGNYPNPFTSETGISYSLVKSGQVKLSIYNTKGQLVRQIVNELQGKGSYSVCWNGTDCNNSRVASGVYFYRLETQDGAQSRKCLLLR
jgi:hypothetical protein